MKVSPAIATPALDHRREDTERSTVEGFIDTGSLKYTLAAVEKVLSTQHDDPQTAR